MRFIDLIDKKAVSVLDLQATYNRANRYMIMQCRLLNKQLGEVNIEDEIIDEVVKAIEQENRYEIRSNIRKPKR